MNNAHLEDEALGSFLQQKKIKHCFFLPIFMSTLLLSISINAQTPQSTLPHDQELSHGWMMQSSSEIAVSDKDISDNKYNVPGWFEAEVPGTVLGALADKGAYRDIFFGRNLEKIPEGRFIEPWWFRNTFNLKEIKKDETVRVKFNGISYRADVWINGHKIASADTLKGSFRQFTLDLTPYVRSGDNVLALKIFRAGKGDLNVGFVDWNPEPADHNMGIWRNVQLLFSGPVSIDNPFVITDVDTNTLKRAELTIKTHLTNYGNRTVSGDLIGTIAPGITFSRRIALKPKSNEEIVFSPKEFSELKIENPKLWWIHTMGEPHLYNLNLKFVADHEISDHLDTRFGIRSVSSYFTKDGFRGFRLNGKDVLVKGGGWTDRMLLNATPEYEKAGIDYALQMNLNAIRMEGFWGGNQHIYDMCDEKGLLIMVGFSCHWEWANYMGNKDDKYSAIITPEQNDIAAESWQSQLLWLRNHPSIFTWLYGSDKWPRPELEQRYLNIAHETDPTRPTVSSAKEVRSELTGPSGMKMRGPYDFVPPDYWYIDTQNGGAFGFNTETGPGPQIPVLESLKKMIPADSLWPMGSAWLYHAARGKFHNFDYYNNAMDHRLGKAADLDDYLRKAQYLNYEGMRAMYEAFETNRGKATGIIQWMYNASWPKTWWQLYDYYLMPTGAFYGARKANEPIHISYNYGRNEAMLMNNTADPSENMTAEIRIFNHLSQLIWQKETEATALLPDQVRELSSIPGDLDFGNTWFLDLRLKNAKGQLISSNLYVLSSQKDELDEKKSTWYVTPQTQFADLTQLQDLPAVKLERKSEFSQKDGETYASVTVKNPTDHLAFMVHLNIQKGESGESVVPVFWDDNYVTLLPGEERTIAAHCHTKDLAGSTPKIIIDGWNVE